MTSVGSTSSSSSSPSSALGSQSLFNNLVVNTSGTGPAVTLNGVISGINTQQVIAAMMQAYEIPQTDLSNQYAALQSKMNDYQQISSDLTQLQSSADQLNQTQFWDQTQASSNNSSVATATSTAGAQTGTVSFNVLQLAQAQTLASNNTVSSTSAVVNTSPFLLSGDAASVGVSSLAGSGLTLGAHSFDVTSALTGGTATGSSALASSITITSGVNDQITANVNGTAQTFTIAAGTYTQSQLAAAISSASSSSGSPLLQAQVTPQGTLKLGTTLLGSSSSLQITGGDALSSLGLTTQATASVGSAGSVTLDGTATAINNVNAGSTTTLSSGSGGSVTLGVGSFGLTQGTFSASEVSPGGGTLSDVVSAINSAGAGVTASAVQVSPGNYIMQLSSNTTGSAGQIVMESSGFNSSLGGFKTVTAAQDAQIQVGGSGGYVLDSSSNAVTGLMQGTTINLLAAQAPGSGPVNITVGNNGAAMAQSVQTLVNDANTALSDINKYAGYNAATSTGGPLMGDSNVNALTNQILGAISSITGSGSLVGAGSVGISLTKTGTITFDQNTFLAAYQANPTGVAQMFSQGGNFSPSATQYSGTVGLVYAQDTNPAGSYAVTVSQSATQATDTGSVSSTGTLTAAENLSFTQGSGTASYAATAGESLTSVASGLNAQFQSQGLSLYASVQTVSGGSQLVVNSVGYGSSQTFTATSSATGSGQTGLGGASGSATFTGQDVQGTIDGVTATGSGQTLSVPFTSNTLPGFALSVTTPGITTSTNLGTFTYQPGIAGGLANAAALGSDPIVGSMTQTISSLQSQMTTVQQQYNSYTPMITAEQQMLTQEFTKMESSLSTINNQSQWLAGQIAQLP